MPRDDAILIQQFILTLHRMQTQYAIANFLMLACGIFWAYIIGSFVSALASMGSVQNEYQKRLNQANQMIGDFMERDLPLSEDNKHSKKVYTSTRVKRFLTRQRDTSTKEWLEDKNAPTLTDRYPTLDVISPGLQSYCALHLLSPMIDKIPYLSLKLLTPDEQAEVAMRSVNLEFSPGERFTHHNELGRGVILFQQGFGLRSRDINHISSAWQRCCMTSHVEFSDVLVEDDYYNSSGVVYHFISFSRCLFIPRSAIMDILSRNENAWTECARWHYFHACLVRKHLSNLSMSCLNHTEDIV